MILCILVYLLRLQHASELVAIAGYKVIEATGHLLCQELGGSANPLNRRNLCILIKMIQAPVRAVFVPIAQIAPF
jgi:hypothetical protein